MNLPTQRSTSRLFMRGLPLAMTVLGLAACLRGPAELPVDEAPPATRVVDGLYTAADPAAAEVRLDNLYASEHYWPHQIQLVEDWKPPGWEGEFGWGMGVLLRVREDGALRVDFARFGKHWIPAEVTDVVQRANAIRLGSGHKFGPNLLISLKNRLLDPSGKTLREIPNDLMERRLFLLVFADPRAADFSEIARSLAPLAEESEVEVVLLPQGGHSDAHVYKACYDAGWRGSFLLDRFSPAYSEGLLDDAAQPPFLQLATPEGRLVWSSPWTAAAPAIVRERLGAESGSDAASSRTMSSDAFRVSIR